MVQAADLAISSLQQNLSTRLTKSKGQGSVKEKVGICGIVCVSRKSTSQACRQPTKCKPIKHRRQLQDQSSPTPSSSLLLLVFLLSRPASTFSAMSQLQFGCPSSSNLPQQGPFENELPLLVSLARLPGFDVLPSKQCIDMSVCIVKTSPRKRTIQPPSNIPCRQYHKLHAIPSTWCAWKGPNARYCAPQRGATHGHDAHGKTDKQISQRVSGPDFDNPIRLLARNSDNEGGGALTLDMTQSARLKCVPHELQHRMRSSSPELDDSESRYSRWIWPMAIKVPGRRWSVRERRRRTRRRNSVWGLGGGCVSGVRVELAKCELGYNRLN